MRKINGSDLIFYLCGVIFSPIMLLGFLWYMSKAAFEFGVKMGECL